MIRFREIRVAAGGNVVSAIVYVAVGTADVPACRSATRRTIQEALKPIQSEPRAVKFIVVAGSTCSRGGWVVVISAYI